MAKINLGSHNKIIGDDYINVDGLDLENVHIVHDLSTFPYPFEDRYAEEILAQEFLEHLPFRSSVKCLKECYRILMPEGKLIIQVPDIGAMCDMYIRRQICQCVPRKATKYEDYKADPNCKLCGGNGKIHPERWRYAFAGAQKHEFDAHLNHFTEEILKNDLTVAGFIDIEFNNNIYKLVCTATKKETL